MRSVIFGCRYPLIVPRAIVAYRRVIVSFSMLSKAAFSVFLVASYCSFAVLTAHDTSYARQQRLRQRRRRH